MKKVLGLALASLAFAGAAQAAGDENFKAAELLVGTTFGEQGNLHAYYETNSDVGYHEFGIGYDFRDVAVEGLTLTPHYAFIKAVNGGDDKHRAQFRATYKFAENWMVRGEYRYTGGSQDQNKTLPEGTPGRGNADKFDDVHRGRIGLGYDFGRVNVTYDAFAFRQTNDIIAARENRRSWTAQEVQLNLNTGTGVTPFVRFIHTSDGGAATQNKADDKALFGLSYWF
ncbi:hypothetical protein [Paraferrimonas sedimenticola]|uniref:Porin n=1 Tax=Paraferrimonas sedimenticola TaxID=375674 RepID=A0AA37RVR0_9GAMM|nr:hypothetical protein [Paraferrimonas sedimenticola]GLP95542.1 hypothetical protein GCM10007895_08480 [Paraferrimonas sedimenticola]